MITIDEAVRESIDNFLYEEFLIEKKHKKRERVKKNKKSDGPDKGKKSVKGKNGQRKDYDYAHERQNNPNVSTGDQDTLAKDFDNPAINIAALAKEVYPHHTVEGGTSQLRKKIKGLKSDSGSRYKLKKKEAKRLRRAANKFGLKL